LPEWIGEESTVKGRLAAICCAAIAASCGSGPEEPGFSSVDVNVSVRSASALGESAGYCDGVFFYGYEYDGFEMPLDGDLTSAVFGGLEPGAPSMTVTILDSAGGTPIAEGSAGVSLPEGDTLLVDLRARFRRSTLDYDIEVEVGGATDPGLPDSILFVGNSYTFANGGLDSIFSELCESARPDWDPVTAMYAVGGYTLQDHYSDPACTDLIGRGGWDLVMLQEQSTRPVEDPELMWEYAALLADVIEGAGGRPGFFMTWARQIDPSMIDPLSSAYSHAGALVDGMVSPVGLAWAFARRTMPGLDLYEADGSHPNLAGTYLVACTMFAAITGEDPSGIGYCCDPSLAPAEKLMLQQVAWEAVSEYGQVDWRHY
jgi:hypothetical protein